jgi:cytochrome oxidase assembly protein ShyY1
MYRFLLRPRWLAFHAIVLAAVVLMVFLSLWQWGRLQDRREFNAEVGARTSEPLVEIERVVTAAVDPDAVQWRAVRITGEYLGDEQVIIVNRSQNGAAGVNVVTPMTMTDGRLLLVNRGFVPEGEPVPSAPTGVVIVDGRLGVSQERQLGGLTDPPGERMEFQRLDIDRIAEQLPRSVAPVSLDLRVSSPDQGTPPFPVPDPELDEGPHLSYAVQWAIFSLAVAIGWVLAVRRSIATRRRALSAAVGRTPQDSPPPASDAATTAPS